jgi:hypothetical protein
MNANISVEPNGAMTIENDRTKITIDHDGSIYLSSMDPIHLEGAALAKLDAPGLGGSALPVLDALAKRLDKKV